MTVDYGRCELSEHARENGDVCPLELPEVYGEDFSCEDCPDFDWAYDRERGIRC